MFEMALLRAVETTDKAASKAEKASIADRWKTAKAHPYQATEKDGEYEIYYVAEVAGNLELHLWCYQSRNPHQRIALPNSPYLVHCEAGKAHPEGSGVDGFTRVEVLAERKGVGQGPGAAMSSSKSASGMANVQKKRSPERMKRGAYEDSKEIYAGDLISVRPKIRDKLGNNTAAPEGALNVLLDLPDGSQLELKPEITIRSGLTNYDVRYEPQLKGEYHLHVLLKNATIAGSPVQFECIPNLPDVGRSSYILPTDTPALQKEKDYVITVVARDRCGNQLEHGGAAVAGRLQSANLPPQQEPNLEVEDKEDGTYDLKVHMKGAIELKVIISIDKDRQGEGGGEFPPIPMTFVNLEALKKKMAKASRQELSGLLLTEEGNDDLAVGDSFGDPLSPDSSKIMAGVSAGDSIGSGSGGHSGRISASPSASNSKRRGAFRQAGEAVIEGFGNADDRRQKTAGMAIVAGMVMDQAKGDASPGGGAKRSIGASSYGSATSSIGSQGSVESPAKSSSPTKPALRRAGSQSAAK